MDIMIILLIWFLSPIIELGIIIGLAISNDNKKREIRELNARLKIAQSIDPWADKRGTDAKTLWEPEREGHSEETITAEAETMADAGDAAEAANTADTSKTSPTPEQPWFSSAPVEQKPAQSIRKNHKEKSVKNLSPKFDIRSAVFQGTAALIIGVVLVVLAGAVFATTTWAVLPDICKVAGVVLFAGLFFGTSALAECKLKLRRTGWAFYTLGCVFLFLTVLAVGYFKLLGPAFELSGIGRWRVLFAGGIVTEIAWCCGYHRFRDRIYTMSCLWGVTVCITFFLLALGAGYFGFVSGLMIYAGLLVLCSGALQHSTGQLWNVAAVLRPFAVAHFWCISLLMLVNGVCGPSTLSMVVAFMVQLVVVDRLTEGTKRARWLIPVALFLLLIHAQGWGNLTYGWNLDWDILLFIYLAVLSVLDLARKDHFWLLLTVVGAAFQAVCWVVGIRPLPTLLLLAGYLFLKRGQVEPEERHLYLKDSCLLMLLGLYVCVDYYATSNLQAILPSMAVYTVGYAVVFWKNGGLKAPVQESDEFWNVLAGFLPALGMVAYYGQMRLEGIVWYLIPCIAASIICYIILYIGKRSWFHIMPALAAAPLPLALLEYPAYLNVFQEHWIYGGYAAVTLVVVLLARRHGAVIQRREGSGGWSVDWYHILIGPILALLVMESGFWSKTEVWSSVYLIMLAVYALQYMALPRLRRGAGTAAMVFLMCAWWGQEIVVWSEWLDLAAGLLPIAAAAFLLPLVWGRSRGMMWLQRSVHTICLLVLTANAVFSGDVSKALLLEAICLAVFVGSNVKKSVWWMRVSGAVLVTVALYMTKGFWLSISWWVYLLVAGLGLILFAAFGEKRRQEKEKDFDR